MTLQQVIGEYEVRLDDKGRFRMPSGLLTQLGDLQQGKFIANNGLFGTYIVLYTEPEWNPVAAKVRRLNDFNKKMLDFKRYFFSGVREVSLDSSDRLLLHKGLVEYAKIKKDMILLAFSGRIEIWSSEEYQRWIEENKSDMSELADELLGGDGFNSSDE